MAEYRPNLSLRLNTVIDTVVKCGTIADIGCDHGYVGMSLVREGIASSAICCDINKGPLTAAEDNIKAAGLEDRIETRLSNGLHNIKPEDKIESIVIAGMGGSLMAEILEEGRKIVEGLSQLVLQPQSELFLVRSKVRELSMHIESEKFIKDMGKYYWIMDVRRGKSESMGSMQDFYDKYSKYLIDNKDNLYREYIKESVEINKGYLEGIEASKQGPLLTKIEELERVLELIGQ